ncbi:MAG: acyl carrier protein [Candidatus Eremiobacteraeota bacterium]|nr:acyl carrier protein [Candidatus Eremiobacteraeota bacterium]
MKPSAQEIENSIMEILKEMTEDWDLEMDELEPDAGLVEELCFSSVDFLHLMAAVEMKIGRKLNYEELLVEDGSYRTELTVRELAKFVDEKYDQAEPVGA